MTFDSKGIDVVVPLGRGSEFSNLELRYFLRSLERHGKGVRRVVILGDDDPGFLSSSVSFLRCPPLPYTKEVRIALKVRWAFETQDLSGEILFTNDDYLFVRDFDARTVPYFQRGKLIDWANKPDESENSNRVIFKDTHEALKAAKLPTFDYELHYPIRYQRKPYLALKHWFMPECAKFGLAPRSVYANSVCRKPGPLLDDVKLTSFSPELDLDGKIDKSPERFCFSYSDQVFYDGFELWLHNRFSEPSQFES